MKSGELIAGIDYITFYGNLNHEVSGIQLDSRVIQPGNAYVAISGTQADGHDYIPAAAEAGAGLIIHEKDVPYSPGVNYLKVADSAAAAAALAMAYYGQPSEKLKLIGITGTNGKTTCATLLYKLFKELGYAAGLISTVEVKINDKVIPATHTTPNPVALAATLADMVNAGCEYCFMEVSSHALVQQRVAGLNFAGGIFTNITRDHLDYHKTFDAYIKAKQLFFNALPKTAFALTNADDKNGMVMVQNTAAVVKTYALKQMADFKGRIMHDGTEGLEMQVETRDVAFKIAGAFNAYNIMAVYGAAMLLEQESGAVLEILSGLDGAEGRLDKVVGANGITAIVDYAHTPDAVQNVLQTVNKMRRGNGKIITVLGCGGDRDKGKRPEMARIAAELSDNVILTSDNPRSEKPEDIIKDMQAGVSGQAHAAVLSITDRYEAIKTACMLAAEFDMVVICGKGHEKYQEVMGVKHPFDDKKVVKEILKA